MFQAMLLFSSDGRSFHTDGANERKRRWLKRAVHAPTRATIRDLQIVVEHGLQRCELLQ